MRARHKKPASCDHFVGSQPVLALQSMPAIGRKRGPKKGLKRNYTESNLYEFKFGEIGCGITTTFDMCYPVQKLGSPDPPSYCTELYPSDEVLLSMQRI